MDICTVRHRDRQTQETTAVLVVALVAYTPLPSVKTSKPALSGLTYNLSPCQLEYSIPEGSVQRACSRYFIACASTTHYTWYNSLEQVRVASTVQDTC